MVAIAAPNLLSGSASGYSLQPMDDRTGRPICSIAILVPNGH